MARKTEHSGDVEEFVERVLAKIGAIPPASTPTGGSKATESQRQKILRFFEHPLFTLPFGILGSLAGIFYTPVFAVCGICMVLAFHRAKVVEGLSFWGRQVPVYLFLCGSVTSLLYGGRLLIDHKLAEDKTSLAQLVATLVIGKIESDVHSPNVEGFLQIGEVKVVPPFLLAGFPTRFNIYSRNKGQQAVVHAGAMYGVALLHRSEIVRDSTDRKVYAQFKDKNVKAWQSELGSTGQRGVEIGKDQATWDTLSIGGLDGRAVKELRGGKTIIYIMGYAQWETLSGHPGNYQFCYILQPPENTNNVVWHQCHL